jgi:hypothetical protein
MASWRKKNSLSLVETFSNAWHYGNLKAMRSAI